VTRARVGVCGPECSNLLLLHGGFRAFPRSRGALGALDRKFRRARAGEAHSALKGRGAGRMARSDVFGPCASCAGRQAFDSSVLDPPKFHRHRRTQSGRARLQGHQPDALKFAAAGGCSRLFLLRASRPSSSRKSSPARRGRRASLLFASAIAPRRTTRAHRVSRRRILKGCCWNGYRGLQLRDAVARGEWVAL